MAAESSLPHVPILNKNTHSEYVLLIAFPLQQWLNERSSILRYCTLPVWLYIRSAGT